MKKYFNPIKKFLTIVVGSIVYALIFYHLFRKENISVLLFLNFSFATILFIFLIIIFWFIYIISQGWYLKKSLQKWDISVDLKHATKIWLSSVALGLVTFGLGGIVYLFQRSKGLTNNSDNKLPGKFTFSYFTGYVAGILSFIILTAIIFIPNLYLKMGLFILVLIIILGNLFWSRLNRITILHALPAVFLNLVLFVLSFKLLGLHLTTQNYLKTYDLNIILNVISPSSGGLGFVEIGLLKYLEYNNLNNAQASIVTLLYRLISLWFTAGVGYFVLLSTGFKKMNSKN